MVLVLRMDQSAGLAVRVLTGEVRLPVEGEWRRPPQQNREWPVAWSGWEADFGDRLFSATFDGAIPAAARLLASLGDHTLRAWWLYLKAWAEFASGVQDTRIDRFEAAATDLEAAVRAAGHTSWFARVEASLAVVRRRLPARPEAAEDDPPIARFATAFRSSARREAWMASVSAGLGTDEHDPFVEAWTRVGQALGYVAEQPEGAAATDSRWRGADGAFVFEAKIDHQPGSVISRRDVNQLLGQIEEEQLASAEVFGAFITVLDRCHQDVGPLANQVTLVSVDAARRVWERTQHLMAMAVDLSMAGHSMADVRPPEGWLRRLVASGRGHLVVPADVDTVWPARVP
jgi:hypothetical protein